MEILEPIKKTSSTPYPSGYRFSEIMLDITLNVESNNIPAPEELLPFHKCLFRIKISDLAKNLGRKNITKDDVRGFFILFGIPNLDIEPDKVLENVVSGDAGMSLAIAVYAGKSLPEPLLQDCYQFIKVVKTNDALREVVEEQHLIGNDVIALNTNKYTGMGRFNCYEHLTSTTKH